MLTPGTLLGDRYEIIEKIGAGGMSIVYKAKDNRLQRYVAIKELREEYAKDDEFVAKFRKEALSAASLSHPNIVGIYDVGNDHDIHYIVMEYIEGTTLKELIAKEGPFESSLVLRLGIQIVSALRHAHSKKIIHRDIKPQNILITHDHTLKVTDFGIAKAVDSSTIVASHNAIGSVHYFSPEQARGHHVNETSDLYSVGIVLFELATKRLPFEADSHISIALKHINENLPKPSLYNPNISIGLERLILKATDKRQSARYQNADEMLRDMNSILQNPHFMPILDEVTEQTILLSPAETAFIRNNEQKTMPQEPVSKVTQEVTPDIPKVVNKEESIYEKDPEINAALDEEDDEGDQVSRMYKILVSAGGVLATLSILVVIVLGFFLWNPFAGKSKMVVVPNVKARTLEQAMELLRSNGLKIEYEEVVTDEAEEGIIFEQDPGEGISVNKNSVVKVKVALNGTLATDTPEQESATLPDLVGLDVDVAKERLMALDLEVRINEVESDEVDEGDVISQRPKANSQVAAGSTVTLTVSKGKAIKTVKVPNLRELTLEQAEESLSNVNLSLGKVDEAFDQTVADGNVISQSISPNSPVDEWTTVDVVLSKGPEEIPVEPTPEVPEENVEEESNEEHTVTYDIALPSGLEVKESYRVVARLTMADGHSDYVFDSEVALEEFPKRITLLGSGSGKLDIYIDDISKIQYTADINF